MPIVRHSTFATRLWPLPKRVAAPRGGGAAGKAKAAARAPIAAPIAIAGALLDADLASADRDEGIGDDIADDAAEDEGMVELLALAMDLVEGRADPPAEPGGAAGSSADAEAPKPEAVEPPPVAAWIPEARRKQFGISTAWIGSGRISAYRDGRYEAVCYCPSHQAGRRCVQIRNYVVKGDPDKRRIATLLAGGRPLGFLAAWLLMDLDGIVTADAHKGKETCHAAFEVRSRARERLALCEGAAKLFELEAERPTDRFPEPDVCF